MLLTVRRQQILSNRFLFEKATIVQLMKKFPLFTELESPLSYPHKPCTLHCPKSLKFKLSKCRSCRHFKIRGRPQSTHYLKCIQISASETFTYYYRTSLPCGEHSCIVFVTVSVLGSHDRRFFMVLPISSRQIPFISLPRHYL